MVTGRGGMHRAGAEAQRGAASIERAAESAAQSEPLGWAARAGLTARGVVWMLIGVLGLTLAGGSSGRSADQKGALQELLGKPFGAVLVILMALGFAGYALWRLSEAAFGVTGDGRGAGPRLQSLVRGVTYLVLAGSAVSTVRGTGSSQGSQQESLTARAMQHAGGRWLVGLVGVVIIGIGVALVVQGWQLRFMRYFRAVPPQIRQLVVELGRVGTIGRGAVLAVAGALVVIAAWTADPHQARGLDGALRTLLAQPYGTVLGVLASLALLAFGVYGLAEATYRRV
jgi:Domain of Unknown Function (DUF1206)